MATINVSMKSDLMSQSSTGSMSRKIGKGILANIGVRAASVLLKGPDKLNELGVS